MIEMMEHECREDIKDDPKHVLVHLFLIKGPLPILPCLGIPSSASNQILPHLDSLA
jgi:hypothetical protein